MDKRKQTYVINTIRRSFYKWPPFWAATKRAQLGKGFYFCEECGQILKKRFTQMDHTDPVISIDPTKNSLEEILDRLLCSTDQMKRLCLECHGTKTALENAQRPAGDRAKGKSKKRTKVKNNA